MKTLEMNIEKYDEQKAELFKLAENCKSVVINGINDKTGYALAGESRKILKRKRCELQKAFKADRAVSNAYSKTVIALEKEVVGIIEPLEREIEDKQKAIDLEKEMIKRKEALPEKLERLEKIDEKVEEAYILSMDDKTFDEYFNDRKAGYLEKKERELKEKQDKLKRDKELAEVKKKAEDEALKAEKERIKLAEKQAEIDKQKAIDKVEEDKQKEIQKIKDEKQAIIDKQKQKDEAEKERIKEEKTAKDLKEKQAIVEQEKLEKKKKYIKFLRDNGYTDKLKDDFYIDNKDNKIILYKKVGEFNK